MKTSTNGKVGFPRDEQGRWRIPDKVDLVLVAIGSPSNQRLIEVYAFEPTKMRAAFDRAVSGEKGKGKNRKAPTFVPLFRHREALNAWEDGLTADKKWKEEVNKNELPVSEYPRSASEALEILKLNVAKGLGIHPGRVELKFNFTIKNDDTENSTLKKKS